ncbi:MAG: hypothetical protein JWQ43_451 [Glaciihabitans sp.]|nr:hypothetical protein [Glaciihabitans sp.]
MNRSLTSLFAAFEALLVVAIGVGIPLAPLTVLWGVQYGFAPNWWDFWRASVDVWLLGHGADLTLTLDTATATAVGFQGAAAPFVLSITALGFAVLTVLLGMRAGRRIAQTDHRLLGEAVALLVFAALSFGLTVSAHYPLAQPSLVQGTVLPTVMFAVGILIGTLRAHRPGIDFISRSLRRWVATWHPGVRAGLATALRGGSSAAATIVAVASVVVAGLIVTSYAGIITLYEGLHAGALGGFALTIAQIAFLPNFVLWGVSWLVGPGFAIGTGSTVSPLGTDLGPIPAIPILGALPTGDSAFAFVGILVPIIAGFLAGALLRERNDAPTTQSFSSAFSLAATASPASSGAQRTPAPAGPAGPLRLVLTGLGIGVVAGIVLGLLTLAAAGSAGPGRLADVGADPWAVAGWAALEVGLAAVAGLFAASYLPRAVSAATGAAGNAASSAGSRLSAGISSASSAAGLGRGDREAKEPNWAAASDRIVANATRKNQPDDQDPYTRKPADASQPRGSDTPTNPIPIVPSDDATDRYPDLPR